MGVELMAVDLEEQLEWAEAQGRSDDANALTTQLYVVLNGLADLVEPGPRAA